MKINSMFRVFTLFMAVMLFSMPFVAFAQEETRAEAIEAAVAAAKSDAENDVISPLWFGAGCALSAIWFFLPLPIYSGCVIAPAGLAGSYFYQPAPPTERLVGKTPEYVDTYTSTYKSQRGNEQFAWAATGCLTGGGAVALIIYLLVAAEEAVE